MSVAIYGAGGTGVNIVRKIKDLDVDVYMVDTSDSNLGKTMENGVYLVDGMDGAGKVQSVTYNQFKGQAVDVITRFKPSNELNIVVASMTGGSGPVLSAMIAKELISRGHNTVMISVLSRQSLTELENAKNALLTLKAMSKQTGETFSVYPIDEFSRSAADNKALNFITLLTLLVDKKRKAEFDTSDLNSFLFIDRPTKGTPSVAMLDVTANDETQPEKGTWVAGTILVTVNPESTIVTPTSGYLTTCLITDPDYRKEDMRVNSVLGAHAVLLADVETQIGLLKDQRQVNKVQEVDVNNANEDGIVLG